MLHDTASRNVDLSDSDSLPHALSARHAALIPSPEISSESMQYQLIGLTSSRVEPVAHLVLPWRQARHIVGGGGELQPQLAAEDLRARMAAAAGVAWAEPASSSRWTRTGRCARDRLVCRAHMQNAGPHGMLGRRGRSGAPGVASRPHGAQGGLAAHVRARTRSHLCADHSAGRVARHAAQDAVQVDGPTQVVLHGMGRSTT
jgi:hypothetical protein